MMKKIFLTWTVVSIAVVMSCQKFDYDKSLTFDVSVGSVTVKAGDPVIFNFTGGDAHVISFYSGEIGNDYDYRDKSRIDGIRKLFFNFQTHNTAVGDNVRYKFLVSNDFNGQYDYESVTGAEWKDITPLYTFGGPATGSMAWPNGWVSSGTEEITSYLEEGQPFYIAVRVSSDAAPTGSIPSRNWRVRQNTLLAETLAGDYISLANYGTTGWQQIDKNVSDIEGYTGSRVTSTIMLFGYYTAESPFYREEYDQWAVSKKFESDEINLGSEGSVSLKQYVDPPLESYTHYYEYPGTYKVVFIASNVTISNTSQVIKEIEITVTP